MQTYLYNTIVTCTEKLSPSQLQQAQTEEKGSDGMSSIWEHEQNLQRKLQNRDSSMTTGGSPP